METKQQPVEPSAKPDKSDLNQFDTDDIIDYLTDKGYVAFDPDDDSDCADAISTLQDNGYFLEPEEGRKAYVNAIESSPKNLKDDEMEQVLEELIAKYGYTLTDKLRQLL
ncbi:hypothetical protein GCM10027299_56160 [Larkinella ripae]